MYNILDITDNHGQKKNINCQVFKLRFEFRTRSRQKSSHSNVFSFGTRVYATSATSETNRFF